jgi:hypothetical protein
MATQSDSSETAKPIAASDGGSLDLSAVKRKRGRPPGSKTKPNPDAPKSESGGAPSATGDAKFLGDTAVCLLEIVDEISAKVLTQRIQKIAPDKAAAFAELYAEVGLNDKDKRLVGMSVEAIARKYTLLAKFGPEVLLVAALSQYGLRQAKLYQFVAKIGEERKAEKQVQPEPSKN